MNFTLTDKHGTKNLFGLIRPWNCSSGGGGVSESTDRRGCAILALEVVPKNLIPQKILPKNLFYKILCLLFQQGNYASLPIYEEKMASSLSQVAKSINYELL